MSLYRGAGGASDATDDSTVNAVAGYASSAASSATNAANSAAAASTSASSAATSASGAATSASSVSTNATNASSSASLANTYASQANSSKDAAAASATTASTRAGEASSSASNASSSAATATTKANEAATSASSSATSAVASAASAASALSIYGSTAAVNAAVAAASVSATTATTQATNSAASAVNAADSESLAYEHEQNAAEWATVAQGAANSAQSSATSASVIYGGISAVNAAVQSSATNATQAITSANNAATSASSAATSATTATAQAASATASAAAASAVVLGNEPVRPLIRPSLLLDFANTKQLDPRITFTRASTATYYGTQTAKAEENLLLQSQDFTTVWTVERVTVVANSVAAPDSTTTADTVTNTTATGTHTIQLGSGTAGYSIITGLTYTISIFAKKNTNDFLQITTFSANNTLGAGRANFDLQNGTASIVDGGTSTITSVGNGWYRCTYTVTASASGSVNTYFSLITTSTAARFESYTGLGTESIYLWGAQLEQRSAVTAYTPTTTQPITNYIPQLLTAASGVARFDHNPITGESLGLEIEESRANLVTYSEQFDNAAWSKTHTSTTANTIVAPDGTLTGDKLVEDTTASNTHVVYAPNYPATNTTLTASVYAKAAERSQFNFQISNFATGGGTVLFNLANGTFSAVTNAGDYTNTSASITPVGNGWYRCSLTTTKGSLNSVNRWLLELHNGISNVYTGNGSSGIYIWGAQLEAGTFASSYIPTVASQVTRAADAASMTGTNFSSWYRQGEGTFLSNHVIPVTTGQANGVFAAQLTSSQTTNYIGMRVTSAGVIRNSIVNTSLVNLDAMTASYNSTVIDSLAYATNNSATSANANTAVTSSSVTIPFVDVLNIGAIPGISSAINGTIRKIAYYPARVTNAQLQGITS